jgi:hypothetical protein
VLKQGGAKQRQLSAVRPRKPANISGSRLKLQRAPTDTSRTPDPGGGLDAACNSDGRCDGSLGGAKVRNVVEAVVLEISRSRWQQFSASVQPYPQSNSIWPTMDPYRHHQETCGTRRPRLRYCLFSTLVLVGRCLSSLSEFRANFLGHADFGPSGPTCGRRSSGIEPRGNGTPRWFFGGGEIGRRTAAWTTVKGIGSSVLMDQP